MNSRHTLLGLVALLAACGTSTEPYADAGDVVVGFADSAVPGFDFRLNVQNVWFPPGPPNPPIFDSLIVMIDDVPVTRVEESFASRTLALARSYEVAVWYQGTLVERKVYSPGTHRPCNLDDTTLSESIGLCLMENAELRIYYKSYTLAHSSCTMDWCCYFPSCMPQRNQCSGELRCSRLVTNEEPLLSQLSCVPVGAVPVGGACVIGEPGVDTGYDDCAAGALCLEGTCSLFCTSKDECGPGQLCRGVPGLLGELWEVAACRDVP